jgi:Tol biopolymer transport system component
LSFDLLESEPAWTPENELGFIYNFSGNRVLAIRTITESDPKPGATASAPFYVTPAYVDRTVMYGSMGNVTEPAFSPDGKFIVYARDYSTRKRIFLAKLPLIQETLKENIISLTDTANDTTPAWSPDGQWIVFTSERDNGDSEIYIMNIAGQNQTNLTNFTATDKDPTWQPASP